jgi:hypothetical protein
MQMRLRWTVAGALLAAATAAGAAPAQSRDNDRRDPAVREEQAARQEARQGVLARGDNPAEFERNRLARCDKHQGEDRDLCIRRMNGEGTVSGSVEGGGIYRELRVLVPAEPQ